MKRFSISTPQRKCRMSWQQSQKMHFFIKSISQVIIYYDNLHSQIIEHQFGN